MIFTVHIGDDEHKCLTHESGVGGLKIAEVPIGEGLFCIYHQSSGRGIAPLVFPSLDMAIDAAWLLSMAKWDRPMEDVESADDCNRAMRGLHAWLFHAITADHPKDTGKVN